MSVDPTTGPTAVVPARKPRADVLRRRVRAVRIVVAVWLLGVVPLLLTIVALGSAWSRDNFAVDFRLMLEPAAKDVLAGESPFPAPGSAELASWTPFVYPPLAAYLVAPFAALPDATGDVLFVCALAASLAATLAVLGVRDWRCYGAVLLWGPVYSALQTGNVTLLLALGAALAWRLRERTFALGAALGTTIVVKVFLWPLLAWSVATRRGRAATVAVAAGLALALSSWALIGFAGLGDYPTLLRELSDLESAESYSLRALGLELGFPESLARLVGVAVGIGALVAAAVAGRMGEDRHSFTLAIAAALLLSPIVWLHYFALLVVPLALARPRFSGVWLLPALLWVTPATGQGRAAWQTALVLAVAAALVATSLRRPPAGRGVERTTAVALVEGP